MTKELDGQHLRRRRPWGGSGHLLRGLLCCAHHQPSEKNPHPTAVSVIGSRSKENVQIIVEDLGSDNPSFILEEEGGAEEGRLLGNLGSSVSSCCGARMKRKGEPLSSMVLQRCQSSVASEKGNEVNEEVAQEAGLDEGPAGCGPGAFLLRPIINLIPLTPSAVISDQFFDLSSEESPSLGRECMDYAGGLGERDRESHEEEEEKVMDKEALESMQDVEGAEGGEFRGYPSAATMVGAAKISRDNTSSNEDAAGRPNLHFFQHSAFEVPPLPQYPRKRKPLPFSGHVISGPGRKCVTCSTCEFSIVCCFDLMRVSISDGRHFLYIFFTVSFNAGINLLKFTEQDLGKFLFNYV